MTGIWFFFTTPQLSRWHIQLRSTTGSYTVKKPCRNAPNSDADNGGAEPNDVGVGIFRSPSRLVRATVVHIGISRSFFYSVILISIVTYTNVQQR
jgi:hypothetical protein